MGLSFRYMLEPGFIFFVVIVLAIVCALMFAPQRHLPTASCSAAFRSPPLVADSLCRCASSLFRCHVLAGPGSSAPWPILSPVELAPARCCVCAAAQAARLARIDWLHRYKEKYVFMYLGICSLMGCLTVMCTKGVSKV